jgi:hypothetical protein
MRQEGKGVSSECSICLVYFQQHPASFGIALDTKSKPENETATTPSLYGYRIFIILFGDHTDWNPLFLMTHFNFPIQDEWITIPLAQ